MNSDATSLQTPPLSSRLPQVGTTIFSVMSALAQQHGAVNLGQGFPDFDPDPRLWDAVNRAMRAGHNQYPPMAGVPQLREQIAAKLLRQHGHAYDPADEITVTAGATQAILTAVLCLVHPGDEVMVLEPCYDSYVPAIELAGGQVRRVPLDPQTFRPDFARIRQALSPRTRALILNTPHNPSGVVWTPAELDELAAVLRDTPVWVISDEVYEHMVFDGRPHASVCGQPELRARSLMISSFGKTFHVTGWKVGFVAAPARLMAEFRKVHQFNVFTVNTPMQHALAEVLADPDGYEGLSAFYQGRRDHFTRGLSGSRFQLLPCEGTYFVCAEYSEVSALPDQAFCEWLTTTHQVAAIPMSAFQATPTERQRIRFCFAKRIDTLDRALERLRTL